MEARDVVVVGAGIAGLTAARELRARGYRPVVLEGDAVPGGRVRTRVLDGARVELGGAVVTRAHTGMCTLVDQLGLAGDAIEPESRYNAAVRRDGVWHHVDHGGLRGLLGFSAMSVRDRLSLLTGAAPAVLGRADLGDVLTSANLDIRSMGEVISRSAATFYAGVLTGLFWGVEPHEVSHTLLPHCPSMVRERPVELRGGAASVIDELAAPLDVRCGVTVSRIEETEDGVRVDAHGTEGELAFLSRAAILATDAHTAARLWPGAPAPTREFLSTVRYSRADFVHFRTSSPVGPTNSTGAPLAMATLPATGRGDRMIGIIRYLDHRAPTGGLVCVRAAPHSGAEALSDAALGDRFEAELLELSPRMAERITARHVGRQRRFVPIFEPGYIARLTRLRSTLSSGSVDLAGDYLHAPCLEGALRSGTRAAARTLRRLATIPAVGVGACAR
ncbi:protoporphyrinogen/coproporphyrinogen oxidase [Pseudonocardia spinosispora]|uniref:protoporphyrinogen/coproporphyrinogen oxidase n=1 Tax=Pseudonocardia spinosispora TaxID=103441 RepID=UPI00040A1D19|nr:FAD-dependent oxidoreductase [Pseudonocardia spinosispora]